MREEKYERLETGDLIMRVILVNIFTYNRHHGDIFKTSKVEKKFVLGLGANYLSTITIMTVTLRS